MTCVHAKVKKNARTFASSVIVSMIISMLATCFLISTLLLAPPVYATHTSKITCKVEGPDNGWYTYKYAITNNGGDAIWLITIDKTCGKAVIKDPKYWPLLSPGWELYIGMDDCWFAFKTDKEEGTPIPSGFSMAFFVKSPGNPVLGKGCTVDLKGWIVDHDQVTIPDSNISKVGGTTFPLENVVADTSYLLAPYLGLVSTITVATVAAAIYVKRRKDK